MYWPIGAARAFEHRIPPDLADLSHDGQAMDLSRGPRQFPPRSTTQRRRTNSVGSIEPRTPTATPGGRRPHRASSRTESASGDVTPQSPGDHVGAYASKASSLFEEPEAASASRVTASEEGSVLCLQVSRHGYIFSTITKTTLTVWLTKPTVILTSIIRSPKSLKTYGFNVDLLVRPDSDILVIVTSLGYLINYSLSGDADVRAYELLFADGGRQARRRSSTVNYGAKAKGSLLDGGGHVREARLHFRMVIKLDAGIVKGLALDHELVVLTREPATIQCIQWSPDRAGAQFSTQMLEEIAWLERGERFVDLVHDKPMNIFAFLTDSGQVYAVQRQNKTNVANSNALFDGHLFHNPAKVEDAATKAAINSRFSLIAVGCVDGSVWLYAVQNYAGGVRLLQRLALPVAPATSGKLATLQYSHDGYCLFAGYERGWTTWSVFGQPGGGSFGVDSVISQHTGDTWLSSLKDAAWIGGSSDLLILSPNSNLIWSLEFARSALVGCFTPANAARGLLQTSAGLILYQGDQLPDLVTITGDASLWHHIEVPSYYLVDQWPIRATVVSRDKRYIALAGQRGLAHYSLQSGRWRTFNDPNEQNEFIVRGGMCWYDYILVAAVETSAGDHEVWQHRNFANEIRLFSRELPLQSNKVLHAVSLKSAVMNLSTSGEDGVLAYMQDNTLDHYIFDATKKTVQLVKVGQIALSGIIRSPSRVRAVSWIIPAAHLYNGDVSQDVTKAAVLFLVDGKLMLLKPSFALEGDLKYEMRLIAHNVEYFILSRDAPIVHSATFVGDFDASNNADCSLEDSLWAFNGQKVKVWPNVSTLVQGGGRSGEALSIDIDLDFYPFAVALNKGLVIGAEAELTQRRDVSFAYFRTIARTTLFLPSVLRQYLATGQIEMALQIAAQFERLSYFSHALEVLLHTVLDEEAERPTQVSDSSGSKSSSNSLLPTILRFLTNFPDHLDIILQCTRKTELRSWRTLFAHLPPPADLFEEALTANRLKTAGGYLLILQQHGVDELDGLESTDNMSSPVRANSLPARRRTSSSSGPDVGPQAVRLLSAAQSRGDWDLCKELARFLVALDTQGNTLRRALEGVKIAQAAQVENAMYEETAMSESPKLDARVGGEKLG